ncbi:MAG TPA: nuclear transport factor 2 family protein [Nitrospiria bacterium]|jgi:ketosteroid isomerase-like protein|nr:nuclear transport factor 2 family protein [Nitrospiria bacterium]
MRERMIVRKDKPVPLSKFGQWVLILMACWIIGGGGPLQAAESNAEKDTAFVKILEGAYQASCDDVDRLHDYYRSDAQIIHDGRVTTLDETIKEIKESIRPLQNLHCSYQPRVRGSRISGDMGYLVVHESIRLSAGSVEPQQIEQICNYVFLKEGSQWKIAVDHCSTIPGESV